MKINKIDRKKFRVRNKLKKVSDGSRYRVTIFRSKKNFYAQLIDDASGKTLASASTKDKKAGLESSANSTTAAKVGTMIAERGKSAGIDSVVFDRGGFIYSQKVKALADAAREGGLKF